MKRMLFIIVLLCFGLLVTACGNGKSAMQEKMQKAVETNKQFKEDKKKKDEAEKKAAWKSELDGKKIKVPALVEAAQKGELSKIKTLISDGTLVDVKDGRKRSALYVAAQGGNADVVEYLITEGANVNTQREDGDTPLMAAARKANIAIVKTLVENKANVNAVDNFGRTVLMAAAQSGDQAVVDYLLTNKADLNTRDKYSLSALIFAMKYKHMDLAKYLIKKGATVWSPKKVKARKKPTTLKIEDKLQPGAEKILEELKKEAVTMRQKTELFYAIEAGDLPLVKLLIKKGAPIIINEVYKSQETIVYVYGTKEEERDMLFERDELRTNYDRDQKNLLHYAAENGEKEILEFLIKKGARLEETDGENVRGPLFYVVSQSLDPKNPGKEKKLAETAKYLITEGLKIWKKKVRLSKKELDQMREKEKNKPWYEQNPFDTEYKIKEAQKVDIEEYDHIGWTVVTLAAKYGHYGVIKELIDADVMLNRKERKFGKTALMYSRLSKFPEIEKLLKANCALEGIQFDGEELAKKGWKCVDGKVAYDKVEK